MISLLAWTGRALGIVSLGSGIAAVAYSRKASSLSTISEAAERSGDAEFQTYARLLCVTAVLDEAGAINRLATLWTAISVVAGSFGGLVGSFAG